jgi:hypothetical protein
MFTKSLKQGVTLLAVFSIITSLVPITNVVAQEAPRCTVASNASVQEGGSNSSLVERNTVWFDIAGASWIWGDADNTVSTTTQTFSKRFIVNGTSTAALLTVAADNGYSVKVNGSPVGVDKSMIEDNFRSATEVDILLELEMNAENLIEITVTNFDLIGINPAGLAFKIDMTGNSCDPLPVDLCDNVAGVQVTIPAGYSADGSACYANVTSEGEDRVAECIGKSLTDNGSFEDPVVVSATNWLLVPNVTAWLSSAIEGFEVWNGLFGGGSDSNQNLELDVNLPSKVTQSINTTPGNVYQVSMDFAPRPQTNTSDNAIEIFADAASIGSVSGTGRNDTNSVWTTHTFNFTAASTSTVVGFEDKGTPNGVGSLLDNAAVCLVTNNAPVEVDTYEIFGFSWDDVDTDDTKEVGESNLEDWTVRAVNASNSEQVITDTTDAAGRYSLNVPAGTWIISQLTETGWTLLSNGSNGDGTYTVTVPEVREETAEAISFLNWLIPTTYAAAFPEVAGPFNFGNDQIEERRSGGSSSGTRVGSRNAGAPTGEVLGASTSTPTGFVLGDATTTMPVGAPNTGAGGTAPVSVSLPTMVAILGHSTRKSK